MVHATSKHVGSTGPPWISEAIAGLVMTHRSPNVRFRSKADQMADSEGERVPVPDSCSAAYLTEMRKTEPCPTLGSGAGLR
jgi:hypothetical protein